MDSLVIGQATRTVSKWQIRTQCEIELRRSDLCLSRSSDAAPVFHVDLHIPHLR